MAKRKGGKGTAADPYKPFFMVPGKSGWIRVPTHKGLGTRYSHPYDVRYNKAYRARRRRAATTRPNPGSSFWTLPVLALAGLIAYGWWKQQQTQTATV